MASGAFKQCPEVQSLGIFMLLYVQKEKLYLDITGTSLRYLDLNVEPEVNGTADLRCSCYNDWISHEICEGHGS